MLGIYGEEYRTKLQRDRGEYAAMRMMDHAIDGMKAKGQRVTVTRLRELRDTWTKNGEVMDFTTMRPAISDVAALLKATGADDYGPIGSANQPAEVLNENIFNAWKKANEEYNEYASRGVYLHTITDPEVRRYLLDPNEGSTQLRKMVYARQGASIRDAEPGERIELTAKNGTTPIYSAPVSNAAVSQTVTAATPEPTPAPFVPDEFEETTDKLIGWDGGTVDGVEHRGLSHIIGAYLTQADVDIVSKNIDADAEFSAEVAFNSLALLQHMRSEGYAFNAVVDGQTRRNTIEARMVVGDNAKVRLFDNTERGKYVGRVYDKYNTYFMASSGGKDVQEKAVYDEVTATRALDYVMGKSEGKLEKYRTADASMVRFDDIGNSQFMRIAPSTKNADIYRALKFSNETEAREFIEAGIVSANAFVDAEFKADELQAMIDGGLENDDILVTSPEFQAELESLYSMDPAIRAAQEEVAFLMKHSDDNGRRDLDEIKAGIVGDYESGFNPAFVNEHMGETDRGNNRDALMSAMKAVNYDMSSIKGNDFAVNAIKERLIQFDPDTAKDIDSVTHPMQKKALEQVQDTLLGYKLRGPDGEYQSEPTVQIDDNGVIKWEAGRKLFKSNNYEAISGEIGQVLVPDEKGIIRTKFQGDNNYDMVPGYTGYFTFDGDYDDRMNRFRAKGYEQHLMEQLDAKVTHQMTRPFDKELGDIPTTLDASSLNGLYHGDVYGKRIEKDWYETNGLEPDVKDAILSTLSGRIRFDNQYSDYATTSAETQAAREKGAGDDTGAFSYWKASGEMNMRTLPADLENYTDLNMTGTGKTQGLVWYKAEGAVVNEDGTMTPSSGMINEHGENVPDKAPLMKTEYAKYSDFDAWDRRMMQSNELMTADKVDHKVKVALMTFGGHNMEDGFPVSKEFAERNIIKGVEPNEHSMEVLESMLKHVSAGEGTIETAREQFGKPESMNWSNDVLDEGVRLFDALSDPPEGTLAERIAHHDLDEFLEEHGTFRPAQRGDKISDMHGNKGTIAYVIDRDMPLEDAEAANLLPEVEFLKANPGLDMIGSPYSPLSRHNGGLLKEMQAGELSDVIDPKTGDVLRHPVTGELAKDAIGEIDIMITDKHVDSKTKAYTREDELDGKGRTMSGQLAWALQAKDAMGILNEIYGNNDSAWSTYREYLIATGLDMKADGTITHGYTPHADEERTHFQYDADVDSSDFLNQIQDQGGFLDMPFDVKFKNGTETQELPVLSSSLRQNVELVDGSMRRSDFTKHYENIYKAVGDYTSAEDEADRESAQQKAQHEFDKIQSTIIDRQFDGGHNGKHSFIRDKMMGKRMKNTATAVSVPDPRMPLGEVGMNQTMMEALNAEEGDTVMYFRDPVWRDGAVRSAKIKFDETVNGISFSPMAAKSHDGDFDGDTYGVVKLSTPEAIRDLETKFSHAANMLDMGPGELKHVVEDKDGNETTEYKRPLYYHTDTMDYVSANAAAKAQGDASAKRLFDQADKQARSDDPRLHKQAANNLSSYSNKALRKYGFGSEFISLTDEASIEGSLNRIVESGAKGNPKAVKEVMKFYRGEKTMEDAREVQYATGVKSDDTGLAGANSQKLIAATRNSNIKSSAEGTYPITQATLQIKKDANHARQVNDVLTDVLPRLFNAKDLTDPRNDNMTPKKFKEQYTDVMTKDMKVDIAEEHIDAITEALTVNGKIVPLKEAMAIKGSPMDRVAYGGGYSELMKLADNKESLLDGKYNAAFAPFSMRNATEETKIAKKDTQRVAAETVTPDFGVDVKKTAVSASSVSQEHAAENDGVVL